MIPSISSATPTAAIPGNGEGGGERGGHAVQAGVLQPIGGDLRHATGIPVLRLLGIILG